MKDPDQPIFARSFTKLKHARLGAPWIAAGAVLLFVGTIIRLLDWACRLECRDAALPARS
jgi:hypothetical protein